MNKSDKVPLSDPRPVGEEGSGRPWSQPARDQVVGEDQRLHLGQATLQLGRLSSQFDGVARQRHAVLMVRRHALAPNLRTFPEARLEIFETAVTPQR